jgi:predicted metalloprotease
MIEVHPGATDAAPTMVKATMLALVAALAVACGGGSSSDSDTGTATPAPTATATLEPSQADQMPAAPQGQADSVGKVHDAGLLHDSFASAESLWDHQFQAVGGHYQHAKLTFFHNTVRTPCGEQSRETGPFYCPPDHGVYLNSLFFDALAHAYKLSSGFAASYIVAHEVGHHVQELLGTLRRVAAADQQDPDGANARSVQVELQADCYAGVWLHSVSAAGELTEADLNDILTAAAVVGDDFQRNQAGAALEPESWTHGSSAQRVHWLSVGIKDGKPGSCDTFAQ